ncbi:hypothetical protein Hanom_Chr11g00970111 [Helianthus anomalus]
MAKHGSCVLPIKLREDVETYVSIFQFNVKTHYACKYLLIILSFIFHGLLTTDHGLD